MIDGWSRQQRILSIATSDSEQAQCNGVKSFLMEHFHFHRYLPSQNCMYIYTNCINNLQKFAYLDKKFNQVQSVVTEQETNSS